MVTKVSLNAAKTLGSPLHFIEIMTLTITNLRVDYRTTDNWFGKKNDCPFIIVNCCFKVDGDMKGVAKLDSEEYKKVPTIDDPERYESWIMNDFTWSKSYDGFGNSWVHNECPWQYIEKFDTFWFREWIADSIATRAIVSELEYYQKHGKLPSVYRTIESQIVLQHLRTLQTYWD